MREEERRGLARTDRRTFVRSLCFLRKVTNFSRSIWFTYQSVCLCRGEEHINNLHYSLRGEGFWLEVGVGVGERMIHVRVDEPWFQ